MSDIYYKIYLNSNNLLCIVEMQDFDECDYNQSRFYSENGEIPKWYDEDEAKKYLNDTFQKDKIDPEFWGGSSDNFWNSFKK